MSDESEGERCARLNSQHNNGTVRAYRSLPRQCMSVGPLSQRGRAGHQICRPPAPGPGETRGPARRGEDRQPRQTPTAKRLQTPFRFFSCRGVGVGSRALPLPDSEKALSLLRTHGTGEAGSPGPRQGRWWPGGLGAGARGHRGGHPSSARVRVVERPRRASSVCVHHVPAPVPRRCCHAIIWLVLFCSPASPFFLAGDGNMFLLAANDAVCGPEPHSRWRKAGAARATAALLPDEQSRSSKKWIFVA